MILFFSKQGRPQAGQLDTTFGQGGIVNTAINSKEGGFIGSIAIQNDRKIVAAGGNSSDKFAICRYNKDGSLDYSFGINGIVTTKVGQSLAGANAVAIQADGRIIAAGYSANENNNNDFTLVRYNYDGTLDESFGLNGVVITTVTSSNDDEISSIVIQSDGKIIGLGNFLTSNQHYTTALVRYNENGSLDNTFGNSGILINLNGGNSDYGSSVKLQKDGKIVIAGSHNYDLRIVRYNQNGALDNTFGNGGIVITPILNWALAYSLAIQEDGKITVAGSSTEAVIRFEFTLVRYNTNGSLDNSFGINGIVRTPIGANSSDAFSIAIQKDGKIIAAGSSYYNGINTDFALARYDINGSLDFTFGTNGITVSSIGVDADEIFASAILDNGTIIAGGKSSGNFALAGYSTDGNLDYSFGIGGIVTTPIGISDCYARSTAIQNDGKIVSAGYCTINGEIDFAVTRYNNDGSLDNTFGTNGIITTDLLGYNDQAYAVVIQEDGKIIVAGASGTGTNDFALVRYNKNGFLDNTFGENKNGKVVTPRTSNYDYALSIALQKDKKIVLGGYSNNGSDNDFALLRYNPDGTLDNTFNNSGVVITPIGNGYDEIWSIGMQTVDVGTEKIVAAGFSSNGTDFDFTVARYNLDGELDNTFGINGIVKTPIGDLNDYGRSLAIQPDGKIVVVGSAENGTNNDFAAVRYNLNGSLDLTFGKNGITTIPNGTSNSTPFSVKIQRDGKILVCGGSNKMNDDDNNFTLARLNQDGGLDSSFGSGGIITTALENSNDIAYSMAIQSNENIIAVGSSTGSYYSVFKLMRYTGNPVTGINEEVSHNIPASFVVEQNYPNPFNPSTKIRYSIPSTSQSPLKGRAWDGLTNIQLKIYDILGREISTLVNKEQQPGNYEVSFDASNLSSGVYIYNLTAGEFNSSRKMVLIK